MKKLITFLLILINITAFSQDTLSVMSYNLYRFPDQPPVNREFILRNILDTFRPDIFITCELVSESGAARILNTSFNSWSGDYQRAAFVATHSDTADPLQQTVFYNSRKLKLVQQQTYPTRVRDINQYSFQLNTEDAAAHPIFLEVFAVHLKAGDGNANKQLRAGMADTFARKLGFIPQDHYVLLGGDFNFYNSAEPAYGKLLDPGNAVQMADPLHMPGNWHDNDSFSTIHTQATRISSQGFGIGGASGGMDDRFDFIFMSRNFEEDGTLQFIPGSYKAFGNNGNCFDNRVDAYECSGPYSLKLRQDLYNMSDHLPVVMKIRTAKHFALGVTPVAAEENIVFSSGNVVSGRLELQGGPFVKEGSIRIYNSIGQEVIRDRWPAGASACQTDVSSLRPGVYFLRLEHAGKPAVYRFTKI